MVSVGVVILLLLNDVIQVNVDFGFVDVDVSSVWLKVFVVGVGILELVFEDCDLDEFVCELGGFMKGVVGDLMGFLVVCS